MPFTIHGPQLPDTQCAPGRAPSASLTVLIVEDNAMLRRIFVQALQQQGYQTETAASEAEAENFRQQQGLAHLALVIANIQLSANPQAREGYALYERWTRAHPTLRFLLMSGDPGSRALPAIRTGAVRFLAKPFPIRDLLDAVQALVGRP